MYWCSPNFKFRGPTPSVPQLLTNSLVFAILQKNFKSSERNPNPISPLLFPFSQGWSFHLCCGFSFPASQKPYSVNSSFLFFKLQFFSLPSRPFLWPHSPTKINKNSRLPLLPCSHSPNTLSPSKPSSFFLKKRFIYLFILAVLGLRCCMWAFSSCGEQGLLIVAVCGLPIAVPSLVVEQEFLKSGLQKLWHMGSRALAQ